MPAYTTSTLSATSLTSGTVSITFDGQTTSALPYNASAEAIQSALVALSNVAEGEVAVTGGPINSAPVEIAFVGLTNPVTATATSTASVAITTTQQGASTGNKVQTLSVVATSGYIVLSCDGVTASGQLAYNANTTEVANHLATIPALSGNVGVSGNTTNDGTGVTITYQGSLAGVEFASLVVANNQLSSVVTPTLTKTQTGQGAQNKVVAVSFSDFPEGSTVMFYYEGSSCNTITYGDSPETVAGALGGHPQLSGNVSVYGGNIGSGETYIEFIGSLANLDVNFSGVSTSQGSANISTIQTPHNAQNTVYSLSTSPATSGNFVISDGYFTTSELAYNLSANDLTSSLAALGGLQDASISVVGSDVSSGVTIEFGGTLAGQNVYLGIPTSALSGTAPSCTITQTGSAYDSGTNEKQSIAIDGAATGGNFTLSFNNTPSNAIDFDATAAEVELALRPCFGYSTGELDVTGGPLPTPIVYEFIGSNYQHRNLSAMTVGSSNLTGATITIDISTVFPSLAQWYTVDKTVSFSDSLSPLTLSAYQHSAFSYRIAVQKDRQPLDLSDMEIVFVVYDGEYEVVWQQEAVLDPDDEESNSLLINCDDSRTETSGTLLWMLKNTTDDVVLAIGQLQIIPIAEETVG